MSETGSALTELKGRWILDAERSLVEFKVRHFWGAITVRGHFDRFEGSGEFNDDGSITGRIVIDASSLQTKNKKRDQHLRSPDFFDVEHHPSVVLSVTTARAAPGELVAVNATLEAAGKVEPLTFNARVEVEGSDAVILEAEVVVDRRRFGMNWSPMKVAAFEATGHVVARFVRE